MISSGVLSVSSPFSGMGVIKSPLMVVPLHRGEEVVAGLSQLDQSLSSNESTVSGVQEKCFVRLELLRLGRPRFAVSDSLSGSVKRDEGVGVWSLKTLLTCGREDVTEARMVSLSLSLWRLDALRWRPPPLMGSSPTATWRRSSTNVHSPALKSSAICFTPLFGFGLVERGAHEARLFSCEAVSGVTRPRC